MAGVDINKFPRWALVAINAVLIGIVILVANRAIADGDKVKAVAYEARSNANDALENVDQLKAQIADVRAVQEVSRKEYREDRIRDEQNLKLMEERIIRAVKASN